MARVLQILVLCSAAWLVVACTAEELPKHAEFELGTRHITGQGAEQDVARGIALITEAADAGNFEAQFALGVIVLNRARRALGGRFSHGDAVSPDRAQAIELLRAAAGAGVVEAQTALGIFLCDAGPIPPADVKSQREDCRKLLGEAADRDNVVAAWRLAWSYIAWRPDAGCICDNPEWADLYDYGEAIKWFTRAAEQGDVRAQADLGYYLWRGNYLQKSYPDYKPKASDEPDFEKGVYWLQKAVDQDDPWAKITLGEAYASGLGISQSYEEANRLWREAAEQGSSRGAEWLAYSYENGRGLPQDKREARRWFQLAASLGSQGAESKLKSREMKALEDEATGAAIIAGLLALGIATQGTTGAGATDDPPQGGGFMDMTDPMQFWGATIMMDIK